MSNYFRFKELWPSGNFCYKSRKEYLDIFELTPASTERFLHWMWICSLEPSVLWLKHHLCLVRRCKTLDPGSLSRPPLQIQCQSWNSWSSWPANCTSARSRCRRRQPWGPGRPSWRQQEATVEGLKREALSLKAWVFGILESTSANWGGFNQWGLVFITIYMYIYMYIYIWRFPKIGIPPNHPFERDFPW